MSNPSDDPFGFSQPHEQDYALPGNGDYVEGEVVNTEEPKPDTNKAMEILASATMWMIFVFFATVLGMLIVFIGTLLF